MTLIIRILLLEFLVIILNDMYVAAQDNFTQRNQYVEIVKGQDRNAQGIREH